MSAKAIKARIVDAKESTNWEEFAETGTAEGSFTCRFENISTLIQRARDHNANDAWKLACIRSDAYVVGGCSWSLKLFPLGNRVDTPETVSVFLAYDHKLLPPQILPKASFKLVAVNYCDAEASVQKETEHTFTEKEQDWGFSSFAEHGTLLSEQGAFMPEGNLHVRVDLQVKFEDKPDAVVASAFGGYCGLKKWLAAAAREGRQRSNASSSDVASFSKKRSRQDERTITVVVSGPVPALLEASSTAMRTLAKFGVTLRLFALSDSPDEQQTVTAKLQVPESVLSDFIVLREMLDQLGPDQTELVLPSASVPFKPWLLVELLGCAYEMQNGVQCLEQYLEDQRLARTDLLVAADYYGFQGGVIAICSVLKRTLTAVRKCEASLSHESHALIENLDTLPESRLCSLLESTKEAVQLQLNAPALATWLQSKSSTVADLSEVRLDPTEMGAVLDALQLMPDLTEVRLDCSLLHVSAGFRALTKRILNMAKKRIKIRQLHLVAPALRRQADSVPGTQKLVTMGIIGIMTNLRTSLTELYVHADDFNLMCPWCSRDIAPGSACPGCKKQYRGTIENRADALRKQAQSMPCLAVLCVNGHKLEF